jgi:hypothetical protein
VGKRYAVIYRTGTRQRFTWRTTGLSLSYPDAADHACVLERQGHKALIHDARLLEAVGVPDTFEAGDSVEAFEAALKLKCRQEKGAELEKAIERQRLIGSIKTGLMQLREVPYERIDNEALAEISKILDKALSDINCKY